MGRLWALLISVIVVCCAIPAGASTTPPTVALVYGDSLTFESRAAIAAEIAAHPGSTVAVHAYPGSAPCDWIPWLATDLAADRPSIFAIETAGNYTRPCMVDANGVPLVAGSAAYYAKLTADLSTIFQAVTATGARVVFIKAPPMLDAAWNARVNKISANTTKLAKTLHQVSVSGAARAAVSTSGKFTFYKPCLATETSALGCDGGQIPVRTLTGLQAGIHFCPDGLGVDSPWPCDMYSSGEYRFGKAIGQVLLKPPKPLLP